MILGDSSVWISYLNAKSTQETEFLESILGKSPIVMPDLVYSEILQGYREDFVFQETKKFLDEFPFAILGSKELALSSAENYLFLRKKGITIRKTIDCYIASYCISKNIPLLHSDRDFDPFVEHLGLKSIF
ncbi:MAG: PIN domain nuclease [Algoriphagus sp.]|nr:PIN domain nuclease [Algoriphagus sp.]